MHLNEDPAQSQKKKEKVLEVWFLVRTLCGFQTAAFSPMSSDDISSMCVQREREKTLASPPSLVRRQASRVWSLAYSLTNLSYLLKCPVSRYETYELQHMNSVHSTQRSVATGGPQPLLGLEERSGKWGDPEHGTTTTIHWEVGSWPRLVQSLNTEKPALLPGPPPSEASGTCRCQLLPPELDLAGEYSSQVFSPMVPMGV